MFLKDRVHISIAKRSGNVLLRSDLRDLGGSTQLSAALRTLVQEGKLVKLATGVYAKATIGSEGRVRLAASEKQVADEVRERLGVHAHIAQVGADNHTPLYVLSTAKRLMPNRSVTRTNTAGDRSKAESATPSLPVNVDELPKIGVGDFIRRLAAAKHIAYKRNRLDDWAEAVTRAAGDDVRLDPTQKLLMLLTKKHIVSGRQAARLLNNYMEEEANVRSVQRLPDRRLSSQR